MFFRLLLESFRRQRRRKLLAGLAILLGTTAVTAMLALATTIGDRIHDELAVYGANIVVTPKPPASPSTSAAPTSTPPPATPISTSPTSPSSSTIFWANNITAISPELHIQDEALMRTNASGARERGWALVQSPIQRSEYRSAPTSPLVEARRGLAIRHSGC